MFRNLNCFSRKISLSGCSEVTSYGLEMMGVHQSALEELDISGCYKVTRISNFLSLLSEEQGQTVERPANGIFKP